MEFLTVERAIEILKTLPKDMFFIIPDAENGVIHTATGLTVEEYPEDDLNAWDFENYPHIGSPNVNGEPTFKVLQLDYKY